MMVRLEVLLLLLATAVAQNCPTKAPTTNGDGFRQRFDDDQDRQYWTPDRFFSEPPGCDSPSDNTRGYYTAHTAPCTFSFHSAEQPSGNNLGFHQTTVCSDENMIGLDSVLEYVKHWKDECVGDFARCYSVERDEEIFLEFVCKKRWNFPDGTTHISVNCQRDKEVKKLAAAKYQDQFRDDLMVDKEMDRQEEMLDKEIRQREIAVLFLLSFMSVVVLLCCYSAHRWFAVPYKQFLESRNHQEVENLLVSDNESSPMDAQVT
mmetsp:Transcript_24030/g.39742  ORF Transcript_24030/g.39742 Transcript_24030/m.39742 type:complete len:262 (+) Transcript_24030:180-965(+)